MNQSYIIAVDFDGTIVQHMFPRIGPPVPGAIDWLRRFQREGAKLILWTMRCCEGSMGDVLTPAIEYCNENGVFFWGVNENPQQKESRWSTSGKVYAHAYVDDAAAGTPLIRSGNDPSLAYVDWRLVGPNVMDHFKLMHALGKIRIDSDEPFGVSTSPQVELPKELLISSVD